MFPDRTIGMDYHPLPKGDPKLRRPDISKAKEILNWQPITGRKEGLMRTLKYFKSIPQEERDTQAHNDFSKFIIR